MWTNTKKKGCRFCDRVPLFKTPNEIAKILINDKLELDLSRASKHYAAKGIEDGIDWESTLTLLRNNKLTYRETCLLESIIAGACWSESRIKSCYPEHDDTCKICNSGEADDLHTYWSWSAKSDD